MASSGGSWKASVFDGKKFFMPSNEYGKTNFREGGYKGELHRTKNGIVEIGSVTQPWGVNGAFFRTVAIQNASQATRDYFKLKLGASVSQRGAITELEFRGNSGSAVGISDTVTIRQALHLTGHQRFDDAWRYSSKGEIRNLYGSELRR